MEDDFFDDSFDTLAVDALQQAESVYANSKTQNARQPARAPAPVGRAATNATARTLRKSPATAPSPDPLLSDMSTSFDDALMAAVVTVERTVGSTQNSPARMRSRISANPAPQASNVSTCGNGPSSSTASGGMTMFDLLNQRVQLHSSPKRSGVRSEKQKSKQPKSQSKPSNPFEIAARSGQTAIKDSATDGVGSTPRTWGKPSSVQFPPSYHSRAGSTSWNGQASTSSGSGAGGSLQRPVSGAYGAPSTSHASVSSFGMGPTGAAGSSSRTYSMPSHEKVAMPVQKPAPGTKPVKHSYQLKYDVESSGISASLDTRIPSVDVETTKTWIYPSNMTIRNYQLTIVQKALFRNTLVALPTGLGKTFIAAVVMYNFFRWYPSGKVVFMAPSKPLVSQQVDACYRVMGIPYEVTVEMNAKMKPTERRSAWLDKRVFFLTPQILANDIHNGNCPVEQIVCVVVDEAHRATGNHTYCTVVSSIYHRSPRFRVLALSATPGSDMNAVQEVISNLMIEHIEAREESDIDVRAFTHTKKIDFERVQASAELKRLSAIFEKLAATPIQRLCNSGVFEERDPKRCSKRRLLMASEKLNRSGSQNPRVTGDVLPSLFSLFGTAIGLYHAWDLLLTYGFRPCRQYLEQMIEDAEKKRNPVKRELVRSENFNYLLRELRELSDRGEQHPKMDKLVDVVTKHMEGAANENRSDSTRIIVFTQVRESVAEIVDSLAHLQPLVKATPFIGQSGGASSSKSNQRNASEAATTARSGMTQKEQQDALRKFRGGTFNVIVCTCIGEEGLDIGDVDLIICYDMLSSPVRMVQRMGRTGRAREGRVVAIITEGQAEDSLYDNMQRRKKTIFRSLMRAISGQSGQSLKLYQLPSSLIMPCDGPRPVMDKREMHIGSPLGTQEKAMLLQGRQPPPQPVGPKDGVISTQEMRWVAEQTSDSAFLELGSDGEDDGDEGPSGGSGAVYVKSAFLQRVLATQSDNVSWRSWQCRETPTYRVSHSSLTKALTRTLTALQDREAEDDLEEFDALAMQGSQYVPDDGADEQPEDDNSDDGDCRTPKPADNNTNDVHTAGHDDPTDDFGDLDIPMLSSPSAPPRSPRTSKPSTSKRKRKSANSESPVQKTTLHSFFGKGSEDKATSGPLEPISGGNRTEVADPNTVNDSMLEEQGVWDDFADDLDLDLDLPFSNDENKSVRTDDVDCGTASSSGNTASRSGRPSFISPIACQEDASGFLSDGSDEFAPVLIGTQVPVKVSAGADKPSKSSKRGSPLSKEVTNVTARSGDSVAERGKQSTVDSIARELDTDFGDDDFIECGDIQPGVNALSSKSVHATPSKAASRSTTVKHSTALVNAANSRAESPVAVDTPSPVPRQEAPVQAAPMTGKDVREGGRTEVSPQKTPEIELSMSLSADTPSPAVAVQRKRLKRGAVAVPPTDQPTKRVRTSVPQPKATSREVSTKQVVAKRTKSSEGGNTKGAKRTAKLAASRGGRSRFIEYEAGDDSSDAGTEDDANQSGTQSQLSGSFLVDDDADLTQYTQVGATTSSTGKSSERSPGDMMALYRRSLFTPPTDRAGNTAGARHVRRRIDLDMYSRRRHDDHSDTEESVGESTPNDDSFIVDDDDDETVNNDSPELRQQSKQSRNDAVPMSGTGANNRKRAKASELLQRARTIDSSADSPENDFQKPLPKRVSPPDTGSRRTMSVDHATATVKQAPGEPSKQQCRMIVAHRYMNTQVVRILHNSFNAALNFQSMKGAVSFVVSKRCCVDKISVSELKSYTASSTVKATNPSGSKALQWFRQLALARAQFERVYVIVQGETHERVRRDVSISLAKLDCTLSTLSLIPSVTVVYLESDDEVAHWLHALWSNESANVLYTLPQEHSANISKDVIKFLMEIPVVTHPLALQIATRFSTLAELSSTTEATLMSELQPITRTQVAEIYGFFRRQFKAGKKTAKK